jgi:hypothetical protein
MSIPLGREDQAKIISSVTLWIPGPNSNDRRTGLTVVLVRGAAGDYAAYMAAGCDEEFTRMYGDKLHFDKAVAFFPSMALEEARYRK